MASNEAAMDAKFAHLEAKIADVDSKLSEVITQIRTIKDALPSSDHHQADTLKTSVERMCQGQAKDMAHINAMISKNRASTAGKAQYKWPVKSMEDMLKIKNQVETDDDFKNDLVSRY